MSIITYKCPGCGSALKFDAEAQNWQCEFCHGVYNNKTVEGLADKHSPSDNETKLEARAYNCSSCGAEIITDATTAATFCYYCHSPAILPGQLSGDYKPSKVIPFKFKREEATRIFVKWCKRKPLLSGDFTSSVQLERLTGIYIPFWLFDCQAEGYIGADASNSRSWTSGDKRYTETKYYKVSRTARASFTGVPADGSRKTDDRMMEMLEPYDYSQMEDFSMPYLSGYFAEKYDMDQNQVFDRITARINSYTSKLLHDTIHGYGSVRINQCTVDVHNANASYVLLPTWMFTYKYRGKTYIFAMNGQTGKIAGNLPISMKRVAAWFGMISAGVFTLLMIGGVLR